VNSSKIIVFVPSYNCQDQIGRVLDQLSESWVIKYVGLVIIVDNQSTDKTREIVSKRIHDRGDDFFKLILNDSNYGLGGSHKVGFQYAIQEDFDWIVVLHGDDQGSITDFRKVIVNSQFMDVDAVLGSRFMKGSSLAGYSRFRIYGNYIFNIIYSICLGRRVRDLGAGLNMYRVSSLRLDQIYRFPDNLTFNCVMLCSEIIHGDRIIFYPITWREFDQVSNVIYFRQSMQTLYIALSVLLKPNKFTSMEHRINTDLSYSWREIDE
jgi:dolichol-phosphate mannosyltransferase